MHLNNIFYLEDTEFDAQGNLNLPDEVIVFVQGNYCGYCNQFKPIYQHLADTLVQHGIVFTTLQIDGDQPGEQAFKNPAYMEFILKRPLEGVPILLKYRGGHIVSQFEGQRNAESVMNWILNV